MGRQSRRRDQPPAVPCRACRCCRKVTVECPHCGNRGTVPGALPPLVTLPTTSTRAVICDGCGARYRLRIDGWLDEDPHRLLLERCVRL